jgi:hypothetical protein
MSTWIVLAAPLLIAAVVVTVGFVGCTNDFDQFEVGTPDPSRDPYGDEVFNDPRLVSYWRLNETTGTTAADSKDGNPGTYNGAYSLGAPGLLQGDPDTAVALDGSSAYVSVPYTAALNPAKFTVEAVVKITGGDGAYRAVVSSRDIDATPGNFGYILYVSDKNQWEAWVGDGTATWVTLALGQADAVKLGGAAELGPYYVALTYDGTNLTLYVNPVDAADTDQVGAIAAGYQPNATNELRIGAGANEAVPTYFFPGVIDEVALYNGALDFATAQKHFTIQTTGPGGPG